MVCVSWGGGGGEGGGGWCMYFDDNFLVYFFSYFSIKDIHVYYGYSLEALLLSNHNICFYGELEKFISDLSPTFPP